MSKKNLSRSQYLYEIFQTFFLAANESEHEHKGTC